MRLHIGINGKVTDVQDIPERPVPTDFCHEAFRKAVREALTGWRYVPAYRVRRVASDPPSRPVTTFGREGDVTAVRDANPASHTERMPLGVDLDYEFEFQVVNGIGAVRAK